MASIYKKQKRWWIHYKDAAGRWRDLSTKLDTKSAAKVLAADLERKVERQKLGLEPLATTSSITFGEIMNKWWEDYEHTLRSKTIQPFAKKHLQQAFGHLTLAEITPGKIDQLLTERLEELSPKSVNILRGHIHTLFAYANRRELWVGPNPVLKVKRQKVPKRTPEYLKPQEVGTVLAHLAPKWRPLFATAFFTGLRKGELLALQKSDVDLAGMSITVRRSHGNDTTKGGHSDVLPIADELLPYLEKAFQESKSELVFPKADGHQQPPDLALHKILRRAMARAGLVVGYWHRCRRKGCGYKEQRPDSTESKCPRCGMQLWISGIPRKIRFHDTRHTTATLLLKAGVPLAVVQKVLRHQDPAITTEVYGHIEMDDMRLGVNALGKAVKPHLKLLPSKK